jgi:hypothetical protein
MSPSAKNEAKRAAGEVLVEEINDFLDRSKSPVEGGNFNPRKKDNSPSELLEEGDLREAIEFRTLDTEDAIVVGVFPGSGQTEKAFGHNSGFSGHPTIPNGKRYQREFIPGSRDTFDDKIMTKIEKEVETIRRKDEAATPRLRQSGEFSLDNIFDDDFLDDLIRRELGDQG